MPGLGFATAERYEQKQPNVGISIDESISGMLFDTSHRQDPFEDFPAAYSWFGDGQVQVINNLSDAEDFGITEGGIMGGVPYYHIKCFYDFIGSDMQLYIMFANCSSNDEIDFSPIQNMQIACGGKLYQIGVWTEWPLLRLKEDESYGFTDLLSNINIQTNELCGVVGEVTDSSSPLNIILCPNTAYVENGESRIYTVDYKKLPDGTVLNFPKISVILGQNGTDDVHAMQAGNYGYSPVGLLGYAMACVTLAFAEENIGHVEKFNLNKNEDIDSPELGFGNMESDTPLYTPISDIINIRANLISLKGYIIPTTYKAKEGELFFSNDQTMSNGDYLTIANNRVIHKCRRIIKSVMLPYINSNADIDPVTGKLSGTSIAIFSSNILTALDKGMMNRDGQSQIDGRNVKIDDDQNIIDNDELKIECTIIPACSNSQITVEELYSI